MSENAGTSGVGRGVSPSRNGVSRVGRWLGVRSARAILCAVLFVVGVWRMPYLWCSRQADGWMDGTTPDRQALANGMATWVTDGLGRDDFLTGSKQFNGEWLFGTYQMGALGFGQLALEQPEHRMEYLALMESCIDRLLSDEVRAFDHEMWGNDPLATLGSDEYHHAAYLGYMNVALGLHRLLDPQSRYADLNDRISEALVRRLTLSKIGLLESYPFEVYPVDNCAVIGSIGLHARATGTDRDTFLAQWFTTLQDKYVDPETGLLIQCVYPLSGEAGDYPRGSGTALAIYFLSFADMDLSHRMYDSACDHLFRTVCGFGGVREYAEGTHGELGDIDSGPVVLGFGLSPTGFLIGGARLHGDRDVFSRLFATAYAWGAPYRRDDTLHFVTGASLGDAILFAMLTATDTREVPDA